MGTDDVRALFDKDWYRAHAGEIEGDPYEHFAATGWRLGIDPHPLFSLKYYAAQSAGALNADENPLEHYVRTGAKLGWSPHVLFDARYYADAHGASIAERNPLIHYLHEGGRLGFDPNPFFVSAQYLEANPDVRDSGLNPLVHYACAGGAEWVRPPHPLFDAASYARRLHLGAGINPLEHFLERMHRVRARALQSHERPDISAIIVNFNKAQLTLQSVVELLDSTKAKLLEVVVVDNGSAGTDFAILTTYLPTGVKLVRIGSNRNFGEGNNIGVEASTGRYLLLLNNDAFVGAQSVDALLKVFSEYPDAGVVGPKFVYPDGTLQECGGFTKSCGTVVQRGKGLDDQIGRYEETEIVDYVSAACALIRRDLFDRAAGFDFTWDPAYYEDVDLCFKIALQGGRTYYCGRAVVTHVEKATSSDSHYGLALDSLMPINREKFICRWDSYIESDFDPAAAVVRLPPMLDPIPRPLSQTAVLYRDQSLVADQLAGYLLSMARTLSQQYNTYVMTPDRCSAARLRAVANELEIDVPRVRIEPLSSFPRFANCDLFVAVGSDVFPPIVPCGQRRIFACAFPGSLTPEESANRWGWLNGYDDLVVFSAFSERHAGGRAARLAARVPPITLIPPVARNYRSDVAPSSPLQILNVDGFTASGRERTDVIVETFRGLIEATGRVDLELHLAGTVDDDVAARDRCLEVRRAARGLPVAFHLNPPPRVLRELYAAASYSWHATGYGKSETVSADWMDPCGSAIVESMSAGAIPIAFDAGAVPELIVDGKNGACWRTTAELLHTTVQLLDAPPSIIEPIRKSGIDTARSYGQPSFEAKLLRLVGAAPIDEVVELPAVGRE
jgi:GT2 family glycosyltransferase/glycosyltransferase involved in cell wall biosynthesis